MSRNIHQIYLDNPITINNSTDLMYFGQSPYDVNNDAAMTYANFSAQFGAPYTASALTAGNDTNVTLTLGGTPATALLHATSITVGWTGTLSGTRGGTGVNNGANTATFSGNLNFANSFTTSGNFPVTHVYTGSTNVTFPTSGTLATTSQIPSLPLSLANGGTGASLVSSNSTAFTINGSGTTTLLSYVSTGGTYGGTSNLVARDSNGNISVNNDIVAQATNTGGSSITLTVASAKTQIFSAGVGSSNLTLPDATTLLSGHTFYVNNNTSSSITVKYNDGTTFVTMPAGNYAQIILTGNGTTNGTWDCHWQLPLTGGISSGLIYMANGLNAGYRFSTATYPFTTTINQILYSNAANTVTGLATANGGVLITNNSGVPSLLAGSGTTGTVLQATASGSSAWSTATFPSTATTTGTVLRANGTNWIASTSTFSDTYSVSTILYASSANTVTGLATANNGLLITGATGVPSITNTLGNDFTITKSSSGTNVTFECAHTSNTSNSNAIILSQVAASAGGDPTFQATVGAATTWSWGIDNSDSDAWVLSAGSALGTSNVMRVSTGGQINYPLQSNFLYYLNASVSNVTGDGTTYTILPATKIKDQNNDFNTGTGTYTAPITGTYMLSTGVDPSSLSASVNQLDFQITTSNRNWVIFSSTGVIRDSGNNFILKSTVPADMDTGDTATVSIHAAGTTKTVGVNGNASQPLTYFGGYLAC